MSIPSSPEVEKAVRDLAVRAQGSYNFVKLAEDVRAAQHAASTAPLLAEIERLKGELFTARKALGPASFGYKDGVYIICLGYHPDTEERQGEYEWAEVVIKSRLDAAEAEAQKLREALTEVMRLCESAGVRNLANGVELGAMSWLMKMTDAIAEARKALGGSK